MEKIELSLVLPIHNQELIIIPVVNKIQKILKSLRIVFEIILVENGSTDNTYKILHQLEKKFPQCYAITAPKGYGSAVIHGLKISKGKFVSYMPSDGQLDPKLLIQLYKLIKAGKYDLVKIKRTTRESFIRFIRSKIFNLLAKLFFKIPLTDINGSPRIFKRIWLPVLNLKYTDSFIDAEMAIKAYFLKWKIKEIPALTLPRLGGKSTVNIKTVTEFIRNLIRYRFSTELLFWKNHYLHLNQ